MKKIRLITILLGLTVLFAGCDAGSIVLGSSAVQVTVKPLITDNTLQMDSERAVLSFTEQVITVKAQAEGMNPVSQVLSFDAAAGLFSGSVKVTKGKEVTFSVEAKDAAGIVYVKGTQTKLIETDSDKISITLVPQISDPDKKQTIPAFLVPFDTIEKGVVKGVVFAPDIALDLNYVYEAADVAVTVSTKEGQVLLNGTNEWAMKQGDEVIIFFVRTGDSPSLLVHPKYVTATFDSNGGNGTMANQVFIPGIAAKLTKNTFQKDGVSFGSWNTVKDGSGTSYKNEESVTLTADTTLYAQWLNNTLTIDITVIDGGNVVVNGGAALSPVPLNGTLSVTVTTDKEIEACKWILAAKVLTESTTKTITINLADHTDVVSPGLNLLTFAYSIKGTWYSKLIFFTVQ